MRARKSTVILLTLLTLSCATLTPPPQLSPLGDIAFYGQKAIIVIGQLQSTVIDAEAARAIPTDDARKIIMVTKEAGEAGILLADALKAGTSGTSARTRAIRMIKTALDGLPEQLSPQARALVEPYVRTINVLLSAYQE